MVYMQGVQYCYQCVLDVCQIRCFVWLLGCSGCLLGRVFWIATRVFQMFARQGVLDSQGVFGVCDVGCSVWLLGCFQCLLGRVSCMATRVFARQGVLYCYQCVLYVLGIASVYLGDWCYWCVFWGVLCGCYVVSKLLVLFIRQNGLVTKRSASKSL